MPSSTNLALADRLHQGAIRLLRGLRAADAESGLSGPKLSALSVLVFAGSQSLSSLAQAEQVRAPTMSALVAAMSEEGLVSKRPDPADRRGLIIEATSNGRKILEEGRRRRLELIARRLERLTAEERALLGDGASLMLKLSRD